jgi:hypothetical protein
MAASSTSTDSPPESFRPNPRSAKFASTQNPFSAEYDKLGYGRIEIFTKPGTDKYARPVSRSWATVLGLKHAQSFPRRRRATALRFRHLPGQHRRPNQQEGIVLLQTCSAAISTRSPSSTRPLNGNPLSARANANPRTRTNLGPRLDYASSHPPTLSPRATSTTATPGTTTASAGRCCPKPAITPYSTEHTVQISDTQIFGSKVVNETRFQYLRDNSRLPDPGQHAARWSASINVLGAFVGWSLQFRYSRPTIRIITNCRITPRFLHRASTSSSSASASATVRDVNTSAAGFNGTYHLPETSRLPRRGQRYLAAVAQTSHAITVDLTASNSGSHRSRQRGRRRTVRTG